MIIIYLSLWNLSDIQNDPLEVDPVNPLCDLTRVRLEPNSDAKLRTPCTQSLVSGWVYIFLYEAWYSPQDWSWCIHTLYLKRHLNYPDSVWAYQIHQVSWRDLIWPRLTYDLPDDLCWPLPQNHLNAAPAALLSVLINNLRSRPWPFSLHTVEGRYSASSSSQMQSNVQSFIRKNITATTQRPQLSRRVACRPCISHNAVPKYGTVLTAWLQPLY